MQELKNSGETSLDQTLLMYLKILLSIIAVSLVLGVRAQDVVQHVNPFIGTANSGNTNPGAVMPWGMVSLSPFNSYDTITKSSAASPYVYGNKYMHGFTHVNLSGVGCADLGTFCLMPITGALNIKQQHHSQYSAEQATPGYYAVNLDRYHIKAELSATVRTGISCYTFPKGQSHILLNMGLGLTTKKGAGIKRVSDTEVEGFKNIGNICGLKAIQTVYFVTKLSKDPVRSGVWGDGKVYQNFQREIAGDGIGAFFSFDTQENEKIYVKTGVSYVSIENARKNLEAEQSQFDFEGTRHAAEKSWEQALSKIQVEGGTGDDKVKFYTAIYHSLLHPNVFNDVNGEYRFFESDKIGITKGVDRYTVFSLWDTYRNLHPFLSLVYPDKQSAMVKSLLGMAKEGGWLPRWEYAGIDAGVMTGDPSLAVIADTWFRGIRDFDLIQAYEAMKHNATAPGKDNYMRPGMDHWLSYGYIPEDAPNVLHPFGESSGFENDYENMRDKRVVWGPVSTGLEYCIADWNLAQLAKYLGKEDDYRQFYNRSMLYKNSFDTSVGFMRPKSLDKKWVEPFDPSNQKNNGFTEGSSWNYTFMVPHDIPGVINLMGGRQRFIDKLDVCFKNQYFDITNEPNLAYPYLYNYVAGNEWKTQQQVRDIVGKSFKNSPDGLPGNDDCGTMSAWLIFSMMGFYPDCPGNMDFQVTSPVFSKITIMLDPAYYQGKTFIISAGNTERNNYFIHSMKLNDRQHKKFRITHSDIVKGGKLDFVLKSKK